MAGALDRIGERWAMLIVRELLLGPLRFSELARCVGGAPTDVLTRRLRDLEADGIVLRREIEAPAVGGIYELTELGRQLEETILGLGRWGLNFHDLDELWALATTSLASALRVVLRPPREGKAITLQLHSENHPVWLRLVDGGCGSGRGAVERADLTLSGPAPAVIAAIVLGGEAEGMEIEGDQATLTRLHELVALPPRLRAEIDESRMCVAVHPAGSVG